MVDLLKKACDVSVQARLEAAAAALGDALASYVGAKEEAEDASRAATAAKNRLNDAQKGFDEVVKVIREAAPDGSDWSKEKLLPKPVEASPRSFDRPGRQ